MIIIIHHHIHHIHCAILFINISFNLNTQTHKHTKNIYIYIYIYIYNSNMTFYSRFLIRWKTKNKLSSDVWVFYSINIIYILYHLIPDIGLAVRVFANGP